MVPSQGSDQAHDSSIEVSHLRLSLNLNISLSIKCLTYEMSRNFLLARWCANLVLNHTLWTFDGRGGVSDCCRFSDMIPPLPCGSAARGPNSGPLWVPS
jgi:hypothetical protein